MKKPHLKAIKQLSQSLPKSVEVQKYSTLIKGEDIDLNEKLKADFPIYEEEWYKKKQYRLVEIDHYNRLKNAFSRNKEQGLMDYIEWVNINNKRMNKLFKELELKEVSDSLLNVVKQGSKNFWSNLIAFLFAFLHTFIKPKDNATNI